MCHRDILDWDASFVTETLEVATSERGPQVGDDVVWYVELVDYVVEQLGCFLRCSLDQGFVIDPFGEFVNADVDPAETSRRGLERLDHIQSLACKGPRCRDRLQDLS